MNKNLIKKYVENIEKQDIIDFAEKENVFLSEEELNIIYNAVKNDTDLILSNDFNSYVSQYKNHLNEELYNLILEKYNKYKKFIDL